MDEGKKSVLKANKTKKLRHVRKLQFPFINFIYLFSIFSLRVFFGKITMNKHNIK